ncbi:MAG: cyclodeaminase/cyclohydrolase family protein [Planctomycetes bacterium]|nr:cyclodeaminase/cyclohydrolase family protein [Planctomycetota bacterium]
MSANKDYLSLPFRELLADLAAKTPTPGGGGAAAAAGAVAASLACMVLEYTVGKEKYAEHEGRLRKRLEELQRAGEEFARLLGEDMKAYEAVVAARKKDAHAREQATSRAINVPMEVVSLAGVLVAGLDQVKGLVNPNLSGDLRVAAILGNAAARSAACTVRENLEALLDRKQAARLDDRLDLLLGRAERHCNAVVHSGTPI